MNQEKAESVMPMDCRRLEDGVIDSVESSTEVEEEENGDGAGVRGE